METKKVWGTWEELVLGGAVLRHGSGAWSAVAAELRSRTRFPHLFSPQECKAKFTEVQERYSGSETWFEELRKQRVAELKRELEKSDNSIGYLQTKIASLSSNENENENSSHDIISSSSKEYQSKDMSNQNPETISNLKKCEGKDISMWCWGLQKKRKRRERMKRESGMDSETSLRRESGTDSDANLMRESGTDSEANSSSPTGAGGEGSSESCEASAKTAEDCSENNLDLEGVFKILWETKECSVFKRRLESQKKIRYKKMIRRHIDLQTVSSKLSKDLISSPKELLRDMLLISNNALVFFPKNSAEYKSAIFLRDLASKTLKRCLNSSSELSLTSISNSSLSVKMESEELDKDVNMESEGVVKKNVNTENDRVLKKKVYGENGGVIKKKVDTENNGVLKKKMNCQNEGTIKRKVKSDNEDNIKKKANNENEGVIKKKVDGEIEGVIKKKADCGNERVKERNVNNENEGAMKKKGRRLVKGGNVINRGKIRARR